VNAAIVPLIAKDLRYGLSEPLGWSRSCDNLLLINPDNPSGNCVPKADILSLLDTMKKEGKTLVLDESFVDFSSDGLESTLLDQTVLDAYQNLIVIKSISKSYGVPGIRLGVLASGNAVTIGQARKNLSIWNINSFGEYFLQIIGKYKKDYREACAKIVTERERFRSDLERISFLEVFPSQANYFMCCCTGCTARELTVYLLGKHDIFIKDLTGKKGIDGNGWIRLAVRSKKKNIRLTEKLALFAETLKR